MKQGLSFWSEKLQDDRFTLLGIALGLTAIHLFLIHRMAGDIDRLVMSALYWGSILYLLRQKIDKNVPSDLFSSLFGSLLLFLVLIKSISLFGFELYFLKAFPLVAFSGLILLISGWKNMRLFWREAIVIVLLSLPDTLMSKAEHLIENSFSITIITAKFADIILWYLGFETVSEADKIFLPGGAVEVWLACTGLSSTLLLLQLALVFMLIFPTTRKQKIILLGAPIIIGFVTGVIRVTLLAAVIAHRGAFDYWHGGEGSSVFSTICIFIFGIICNFLLESNTTTSKAK